MTTVWLNWATLASSAASLITAIAALIAFVFLKIQQRQTERQITGTTSRYMYEEMSKLLGILLENPDLRPFIYEGRSLDLAATESQRQQVLAIAGLYSDFFEQLLYQRNFGNLSKDEYAGTWQQFINTILASSTVLRDFALQNRSYYGAEYMDLVMAIQGAIDVSAVRAYPISGNTVPSSPTSPTDEPSTEKKPSAQ